jgi:HK97 family phage major capsid protein
VPETSDENHLTLGSGNPIPDSKIGSGKVQLTAKKLALRVGFSAELAEDSLVPVLAMYREQAMRALADAIDSAILNGDTETGSTGNINSDNQAPPSGATYLAFDGLRMLPLVTTTANAVDASTTFDLTDLRNARFSMAHKYSVNPRNLAWICDGGTYAKLLALEQFLTMDKAGPQATALTGQIGAVDGIPVLVSAAMPLTDADGKITIAGTNNKGQAVCVYRPGWIVGYRRRIAASVDYLPYYDAYQMTATVRLALARLDSDVSAAVYNISV